MRRSSTTDSGHDCPSRDKLQKSCVGRLPPQSLEHIAEHVAGCSGCRALVDALPQDSDALLSHLRACANDCTGIDDPECRRLETQALAIRVRNGHDYAREEWAE